MTTATTKLSTEDMLAIQQLYGRYNHAIDSGDGQGWASCFTANGTFTSPASGSLAGTEALATFAEGFAGRLRGRHWINNLVLESDGDGARGKCYLMLLRLVEGQPASILATGIYDDRLVKRDGSWVFASRNVATEG
ncbi:MAG TPA: nuclear transport factor 2 family protein [Tepidiformaceae bacterium]|nr:nuclear transport factor 2 family protein [Tepidiformaceae bacterium]